jgi:hypothetical protein
MITDLQCIHFALFLAQPLLPSCLRLSIRPQTTFKLVNLLPTIIKLLPHIIDLLCKLGLSIFTSLLEIYLDLTEGFQPGDEVVMKDAEVCEWLCFGMSACFL